MLITDFVQLSAIAPAASRARADRSTAATGMTMAGLSSATGHTGIRPMAMHLETIGGNANAAVRMHFPVRGQASWSYCPKFGKASHSQHRKVAF